MEHTAYSILTSRELVRTALQSADALTRELALRLENRDSPYLPRAEFEAERTALASVRVSA